MLGWKPLAQGFGFGPDQTGKARGGHLGEGTGENREPARPNIRDGPETRPPRGAPNSEFAGARALRNPRASGVGGTFPGRVKVKGFLARERGNFEDRPSPGEGIRGARGHHIRRPQNVCGAPQRGFSKTPPPKRRGGVPPGPQKGAPEIGRGPHRGCVPWGCANSAGGISGGDLPLSGGKRGILEAFPPEKEGFFQGGETVLDWLRGPGGKGAPHFLGQKGVY